MKPEEITRESIIELFQNHPGDPRYLVMDRRSAWEILTFKRADPEGDGWKPEYSGTLDLEGIPQIKYSVIPGFEGIQALDEEEYTELCRRRVMSHYEEACKQIEACRIILKYTDNVGMVYDSIAIKQDELPAFSEEDKLKLKELGYSLDSVEPVTLLI